MSMIACQGCGQIVNSDNDPDCFVEVGNMRRYHETRVYCEACRERRQAEQDIAENQPAEPEGVVR